MKLKKNIATSEAGFVFNPGTGDSFSVNQTGSEILSLIKQELRTDEIIRIISSKFDADITQIERDVDDFISQLHTYNLVEK
ncbi:MAG: PqqD family protein [Bacteroidia bacterium]|nr:PqqD family protein [Bacteroidia bacterium]